MDEQHELLSLQEASTLLGVNTSTLRRWADTGRVPMQRTLGGHRRFSRAALVQLVHTQELAVIHAREVSAPPVAAHWGVDEHELARQEWHTRLTSRPASERMRGLGQRLLGLLIQYINRREDDERFLSEARAVGANYGSEARAASINLHDTIEAFLFFRSSFAQLAMPLPGIAQPTDLAEAKVLHARIDRFMDGVLLGVVVGYEAGDGRRDA